MNNLEPIKNKSIALIIWNKENEDDVRVYLGQITEVDEEYYFINTQEGWKIRLEESKLTAIREVSDDLKDMLLGADLCLNLTIATLPDDNLDGLSGTGMNW